jgi:hypothetical protein
MNVLWERLRTSLWPIPLLMLLASVLLLEATLAIDARFAESAARSRPMLRALAKLAEHARGKTQFECLREEGRLIAEVALSRLPAESERRAICDARDELQRKLA